MAIYHFSVKRIGGKSGRSSFGAAMYHSGGKGRNEHDGVPHDYTKRRGADGAAAYHSGVKLNEHDYAKKIGIVHSEVMLPKHAPESFRDSGTLWNSVEMAKKQHNEQTSRMVVVALPNELTPEQNINMVRDYIQRNFVGGGMCAHFSLHSGHIHEHKDPTYPFQDLAIRKDNPHVHIQLTMRPLNSDGTWANKARKEYILDKNGNRIKLPRGEWKSRNIPLTDWEKPETLLKWRENWAVTVNKELERHGFDERISHKSLKDQGIDREPTIHMGHTAWNLEKKGIKTEQGEINREIMTRNKAKEMMEPEAKAEQIHKLREDYIAVDTEVSKIKQLISDIERKKITTRNNAEEIEERAGQIQSTMKRIEELRNQRQRTALGGNIKKIDEQIQSLVRSHEQAGRYFLQKYQITPEEALTEIKRLEIETKSMERTKERLQAKLPTLLTEREAFKQEYLKQKLLIDIRHDRQRIYDRMEKLDREIRKNSLSPKDEIARLQSEAGLTKVTEHDFEKIMQSILPEQREILEKEREREKVRERLRDYERDR